MASLGSARAAALLADVAGPLRAECVLFGDSQQGVGQGRPVQHAGVEEGRERRAGSAGAPGRCVGGLCRPSTSPSRAVRSRTVRPLLALALLVVDQVGEADEAVTPPFLHGDVASFEHSDQGGAREMPRKSAASWVVSRAFTGAAVTPIALVTASATCRTTSYIALGSRSRPPLPPTSSGV